MRKKTYNLTKVISIFVLGLLAACNNLGSMDFPGVYKISIPQGNIITQDMIDQLRPGMSKRQVMFVMGTPLIRDPYNQDRWDYVYNFQPGGGAFAVKNAYLSCSKTMAWFVFLVIFYLPKKRLK